MYSCVGEFVDHQQSGTAEEPHSGGPSTLQGGFAAAFGQLVGGGEVDAVTGLGGGAGQPDGQHRLAGAGRADKHALPASSRNRRLASSRMSFSSTPGWAVKSNPSRLD